MTTELTKAAQQALEALKLCYDVVEYPANGTSRQDKAIAALERALTQRPAAQTEREAVVTLSARIKELISERGTLRSVARSLNLDVGYLSRLERGEKVSPSPETLGKLGLRDAGVRYGRLAHAPQQATPEPVAFSHAGHFYNLISHALMDVKRPDACGHRLRLILDELATLMGQPATPEPVGERWVVVRETSLDVGEGNDVRTGGRPELGYALISDAATFGSEDAAVTAIKSASLPVGWVVLPLSRLLPDLGNTRPAPGVPEGLIQQVMEALRDGLSVCESVQVSRDRKISREGCALYAQTEEWCRWLDAEVGPKIRAAVDALAAAQAKGGE